MHEAFAEYLAHLDQRGHEETARTQRSNLRIFGLWLLERRIDPLEATTEDLREYQRYLSGAYLSPRGHPLVISSQASHLCAVKAVYRWLHRRGRTAINVARKIQLPKVGRRTAVTDALSLQEATALLQTQAAKVTSIRRGCHSWAKAHQLLTLLCVGLATGNRRAGLRKLRVGHLDFRRTEIRVEKTRNKPGRVLPVAPWAMSIAREYVQEARPILDWDETNDYLFVGERSKYIGNETLRYQLADVVARTVEANPDLTELRAKTITPQSLRISLARLLFNGGADIRTVNEMMMHERLETTAYYTSLPVEDLRHVCHRAHPRA